MRVPLVVLLALLLVAPMAHAGDQSGPDITDGSFPTDPALMALRGDTTAGAPEIDIQAVWLSTNATDVTVTWEVLDGTHRLQANETILYSLAFDCGTRTYTLDVEENPDGRSYGHLQGVNSVVNVTFDGNLITAGTGRAYFPCATLTHLHASSILLLQTSPTTWWGGGTVWRRDVAPAQGYGRDFTFG